MNKTLISQFVYWQREMGLTDYLILTDKISIWKVMDEKGRRGKSLVGVTINRKSKVAILKHTRQLREEDIIHEFKHIEDPELSHKQVVIETERLVRTEIRESEPIIAGSRERY